MTAFPKAMQPLWNPGRLYAADLAKSCGACRVPLKPDEELSLLVNITQSTAPDGTEYLTFADCVCHPSLQRAGPEGSGDYLEAGRTFAGGRPGGPLTQKSRAGRERIDPVLAYTLVPVLSFGENGRELTSALVFLLLNHGFQMAMSPNYPDILEQAGPTAAGCSTTLTPQGLIRLTIDAENLYREQLDPEDADDAEWLRAVRHARSRSSAETTSTSRQRPSTFTPPPGTEHS
ncbi:hypothetical protein [Arthrobacter globiformis]|uniref:hypothetical protein n=1 Tax=Arthrobacter globiformis TaxID=1665 RepID=UPI002793A012|nr:hypothetical protein [Arthrobacter globiformis]MDQ0618480.1 hypothetical protein [Arthrobacter globiformis]